MVSFCSALAIGTILISLVTPMPATIYQGKEALILTRAIVQLPVMWMGPQY
jgi:hypothetical protein